MSTIADLAEDRVVEGVYAVARKRRLRTRGGSRRTSRSSSSTRPGASRARVWNDVELLDARFGEGDAVRVLGRVERFRDRLQLDVRSHRGRPDDDPAGFAPAMRRDPDELDGFLEFLAGEISHAGLRATVRRVLADGEIRRRLRALPATPDGHHAYAGGLLEHTVGVATLCREIGQLHPRLRADLLLAAALLHDVGRTRRARARARAFRQTDEGRLLGHVHLGHAADRGARRARSTRTRAPSCSTRSPCHHDARAAKTAEAAVLYHANQLDAVAATRPVDGT